MATILTVPSTARDPLQEQARALFTLYGEFLRRALACGAFDFARFAEEVEALPGPYTELEGEVLVALVDGRAAGCIAYRSVAGEAQTCEIKRLFVHPEFRGEGLARALVAEALERIDGRRFERVILDTDTARMPAALALYLSFGFREYASRKGGIAYLDRVSGGCGERPGAG